MTSTIDRAVDSSSDSSLGVSPTPVAEARQITDGPIFQLSVPMTAARVPGGALSVFVAERPTAVFALRSDGEAVVILPEGRRASALHITVCASDGSSVVLPVSVFDGSGNPLAAIPRTHHIQLGER